MTEHTIEVLKACPFCGQIAHVSDSFIDKEQVGCFYCVAFADRDLWNTRPLENALLARAEKAESELNAWHKMAIRLAEQLEYPDGLYGLTHCDSTTLQSYRDLSQRYLNVPCETKGIEEPK